MIFTNESIAQIRAGRKTETRRIWKENHVRVGRTYICTESRWFKPPQDAPRIRVTSVTREPLGVLEGDLKALWREGFDSWAQFEELWKKLHGRYDPKQVVYVVGFELVS